MKGTIVTIRFPEFFVLGSEILKKPFPYPTVHPDVIKVDIIKVVAGFSLRIIPIKKS